MTATDTAALSRTAPVDCPLDPLFAPRGIAVVGASRNPGKLGAVMARSLATFGGRVVRVNSRDPDPDAGLYRSVAEAADAAGCPVDLAVVCVPAAAAAAAVAEAAAAGARAAMVCAGGFAEAGPDGAHHERMLRNAAADAGLRLLGPNTSGFLAPARRLTASFVPGAADVPAGGVGVVAASGGVNHAVAFLLADGGHGVSLAVGLGNAAGVGAPDVLEHLRHDPATTAVALHLESVPDGGPLVDAVSRLADTKPVVALVVGRSEVGEFARSHTGALATSWRTTRAVLRQAGAVLVDDERELVDAVGVLSRTRLAPAADPGVGIVTGQAGPGLLLLDRLRADRVRVPALAERTRERLSALLPPVTYQANPVDTGRPDARFGQVLETVATDESVDIVAGYALAEPDSFDLVSALTADPSAAPSSPAARAVPRVAGTGGTPAEVAATRNAVHAAGVPLVTSPAALATGVRALVDDARAAHRRSAARGAATSVDGRPPPAAVPAAGPQGWDEAEAKQVLDALGVATPPRRVCETLDEAHRALDALGGPVALKLLDPAVTHKTDVGGVRLGIRTHDELARAGDELVRSGARRFLVEVMAPPGVDLLVGARRDPVFGPVVVVGLGGTAAEAFADVTVRSVPLTPTEAETIPDDLVCRRMLEGWRGGPVLDRTALGRLVRTLGQLLVGNPSVEEVEINPLRLTRAGLVALDAVITSRET